MTIEDVLVGVLSTTTAVTAIVGQRIYPVGAALNPEIPYLTYAIDETDAIGHLKGLSPLRKYTVLIQFWTVDKDSGKTLDSALFTALSDYVSGNTQRIKFLNRTDVDRELDYFEASQIYEVWYLVS